MATNELIEVELPVCERCNKAGKIPNQEVQGKFYCTGADGHRHKREQMKPRLFREVPDAGES